MPFSYLSLCSGIEAATVAWEPLGWIPAAFAEIENFPSALLAHYYPSVPNLGDITKISGKDFREKINLIVGGSPCQANPDKKVIPKFAQNRRLICLIS